MMETLGCIKLFVLDALKEQ